MLTPSIAKKIIEEVKKLTKEQLIMTNKSGTIIASTQPDRVGTYHEGAYFACMTKMKREIRHCDEKQLKGVKAGICLPIFFHQEVIGVIGITGDPLKVDSYGELIKKMTELLIHERYYYNHKEWMQRAYQMFLFEWLTESEKNEEFYERASVLQIDLQSSKRVIIGRMESLSSPNGRFLYQDLQNLFEDDSIRIFQWTQTKIIFVVDNHEKWTTTSLASFLVQIVQYCRQYYRDDVHFGVGQTVPALKIRDSYLQAEKAVMAATLHKQIVFEEDLDLEMCLQEIPFQTKIRFVKRVLGPIIKEKELLRTLKMFIKHNAKLKETANSLNVHINTLHYRLKKIEELTGYHPKEIKDMATLFLAIEILDKHPNLLDEIDGNSYIHP